MGKLNFKFVSFLFLISFTVKGTAATDSEKSQAAKKTASTNSLCKAISPFYWEIGNQSEVLASGALGSVDRDQVFPVASASKWFFGAYVVEKLKGSIDPATENYLEMSAGFTSFKIFSCLFSSTVHECLSKGTNSKYTSAHDHKFYYNGGHFQKWAEEHGMGSMNKDQLTSELQNQLGSDLKINFTTVQLAGGLKMSAGTYALFLRKILSGKLLMKNFLGAHPVCTLPKDCPQAIYSPAPYAWHYSYGHWVEDDVKTGDGSFSSAGLFGFYPWIDATKTFYGLISRHERPKGGDEGGSGFASVQCGRLIRKAYATGVPQ